MKYKKTRKGKHLSWTERLIIENMLKNGFSKEEIGIALGRCTKTIYNEIKRGSYEHLNSDYTIEIRYSPDMAEMQYRKYLKEKGKIPKLIKDKRQREYIEYMIAKEKFSPRAVLDMIKENDLDFDEKIKCKNTIYNAIEKGYFKELELKHLPRRGKKICKRRIIKEKTAQLPRGTSIEFRAEEILKRNTFGHWEMDCVEGSKRSKKVLLVFTERYTRFEIIEQMKSQTTKEVKKALNRIEKRLGKDFYKIFQTITVDNGKEFKDVNGLEKAINRVGKRTKVYYCHSRSPEERGSNENANILIRRWFPKGANFDKMLTRKKVKEVQWWVNTYPRTIFHGKDTLYMFNKELKKIGCKQIA